MRHHVLVAYDISDATRLRKVARIAQDFGDRVQLSVFACRLNEKELAVLRERLRRTMDAVQDQVVLVKLAPVRDESDPGPGLEVLGRAIAFRDKRQMIF